MVQDYHSPFLLGPEETAQACLLIHGFSGSPAEMRGLGQALARQGIRVYGVALAGHSGDPEDLLRHGWKHWLASVEEGLAKLARYPQVFVVGFSLGGVLALLLTSRHPRQIAGVIALSTPTRFTDNWQARVVPLARYFMTWFYPLQQLDFSDPKVQAEVLMQARLRDPNATIDFSDAQTVATIKQMVRIPIPAIAEMFHVTNLTRRRLGLIRGPLLILQGKRDRTVNPHCADELYRRARLAHPKSLYWLEQSDHMITTGPERLEVYQRVLDFIGTLAPSSAVSDPGASSDDA